MALNGDNKHLFELLIRLGDDHFILGHRLSQWCGHAPMLEEDLALSNIALDMMGQARALYTYAGEIEGEGRDEDAIAFLRKENEYHNLMLCEQDNGDFAHTMIRQLFFSQFMLLQWSHIIKGNDQRLGEIAAKAIKETSYHVNHCAQWVIRLGDGTEQSAERVAHAVTIMAPLVAEMFENDDTIEALVEQSVFSNPEELKQSWEEAIHAFFIQAKIDTGLLDVLAIMGARKGNHSEAMGHILSEVQFMQRTYPGLQW